MKKNYKVRHAILEALFENSKHEKNPQAPKKMTNIEISKKTGIAIEKIDLYHEMLHEEEEIICTFNETHLTHSMIITSKGRQSFIDRKFLTQGSKQMYDSIYDPLKIALPVLAILISLFSLYRNNSSSHKVENIELSLKDIQHKMELLEKEKRDSLNTIFEKNTVSNNTALKK